LERSAHPELSYPAGGVATDVPFSAELAGEQEARSLEHQSSGTGPDVHNFWEVNAGPPEADPAKTALLIIDMQYMDAHRDWGMGPVIKAAGKAEEWEPYFAAVDEIVPRIRSLQDAFRASGMEVIHVVTVALTQNGRDISRAHKRLGLFAKPGSREAEVLDELKPVGDEIVITKTANGVFNATAIDQILKNLGIETLVVVGVGTNDCVETAVRDASDRGYDVLLVGDACATRVRAQHEFALTVLDGIYSRVVNTADILAMLERTASGAVGAAAS
jgi:nicotinamidase-related amidase